MSHSHETHANHAPTESAPLYLRPLHDKVVVERAKAEKQTPGGIIIPDQAQEKSLEVTVRAVGPGRVLDDGKILPLSVKPGDVVYLPSKYAGTEVTIEGRKLVVVREEEILAAKVF